MKVEFKCDDPKYTGPKEFFGGTEIKGVKIFTEDLPSGFDTLPFQPFLVQKDNKYAILSDLKIPPDKDPRLTLTSLTKPPKTAILDTYQYEKTGLRITLTTHTNEPKGRFYPK